MTNDGAPGADRSSASRFPVVSFFLALIAEGVLTLSQGERVAVWFAVWLPLGLGGVQIVSTCWRGTAWLFAKESRRLLFGEFVFAGLMPVGIGLLDNHFRNLAPVLIPSALLLAAVALGYETAQDKIAQRRPAGTRSGTTRFASVRVGRVLGDRGTTIKTLAGNRGAKVGALKGWIEEDEQQAQLADPEDRRAGGMRRAFAAVLLFVAALPVGVGIARIIHPVPGEAHGSSSGQKHASGKAPGGLSSGGKGGHRAGFAIGGGTSNTPQSGAEPRHVCSEPVGTPPAWARGGVQNLLGLPAQNAREQGFVGPAYGKGVDGTPSSFHSTTGPLGRFTWAFGIDRNNCETMSILVDSDAFGPAAYLAPAVSQVMRLINVFHDIGGVGRAQFDAGLLSQIYVIDTPEGTALLIRTDLTGEYTLLPPAAAAEFIQDVRIFGSWLWPVTASGPSGEVRIHLDVSPQASNRKFSIDYNATTLAVETGGAQTRGIPIPLSEISILIRSAAG